MRALVVFESMFGNTRQVAEAVAAGLSSTMDVELAEVGGAPTVVPDDLTLLVVGGPTHAFGMSRTGTRQTAATKAEHGLVSTGIGLREWLPALRGVSTQVAAAAFDTKVRKPWAPGSAASAAHKRLRRLGFRMATRAQSFYVKDMAGPLLAGELDRARRWGEKLGTAFHAPGEVEHGQRQG